jgi:DNA-binding winged helix-turn-helix (wHTH) protein/TolB-like protein
MMYRFGVFEFDADAAVLKRSDRIVSLEPQPARALALLLSRAGEVVTRDEMRAHLWASGTHVDFDRGLAYCIGQLRAALGDTADNPRFVQTLPRRGFRFIAPVEKVLRAPVETIVPLESAGPAAAAPTSARRLGIWFAATAGLVLAAASVAGIWMVLRDRSSSSRPIVAVAVFDNETGDAGRSLRVAGMSDVIVDRLTALGPERIGVTGNATTLRQPRVTRDLQEIGRQTRATFLVLGQLQAKDGQLSLLMQLIKLDDGTHVWARRITRPQNDPLDKLDEEAARQIEAAVRHLVLGDASARPDASG